MRDIDERHLELLKQRAKVHGRSLQGELKLILERQPVPQTLMPPAPLLIGSVLNWPGDCILTAPCSSLRIARDER